MNETLILTGDVLQWNSELSKSLIALDVILCLYIVLGVVGNAVVVFIYGFRLKIGMDDRFFILVLGIMDTIVCCANPAFALWRNLLPVNSSGNIICKVTWFCTRTISTTSGLLILIIALQRFLKVCRPFGRQMTSVWKRVLVACAAAMSCLMHTPLIIFYGEITLHNPRRNVTGKRCGLIDNQDEALTRAQMSYFYFMFASAGLVLLSIVILYSLIGQRIYEKVRRKRERKSSMPSSLSSQYSTPEENGTVDIVTDALVTSPDSHVASLKTHNRKVSSKKKKTRRSPLEKHRYTLMFMLIAAVCVATYVPSLTANIIQNIDSEEFWTEYTNGKRSLYIILFQLYILNHVANPFIYGLFDGTFRLEVRKLFCKGVNK
ncbi:cholecystokinin receptor type A-like [Mizuhopecten yessoensis]|uniref:Cholecystokinin receptor type A n=1 Tax=Mizuhopecten yessoensis TaxID=6573 RepID=A0A210QE74_MIZYE|nr:cholecystokinin receptor type A-like [Mizuhopecten yessoensis]OWF47036.1 Cholecystokinin receptor type A [Mizuhopecten yessoensis]